MKNPDSHIYLYAKGWYEKTDVVEDLKVIFGERNAIEPDYITEEDLVLMLLNITWPHIKDSGNPALMFKEFVMELNEKNYWKLSYDNDWTFNKAVIEKCLSVLSMVIIPLDAPDQSILPLDDKVELPDWFKTGLEVIEQLTVTGEMGSKKI